MRSLRKRRELASPDRAGKRYQGKEKISGRADRISGRGSVREMGGQTVTIDLKKTNAPSAATKKEIEEKEGEDYLDQD